MEVFIDILIFILGSFIGSFASLAVYRIPLKEDILIKHSYCPNCKTKLKVLDLIPIFSYIFLKGKCRHCSEKIRARYLILEILSGFIFLLFYKSFKLDLLNINLQDIILIFFIALFFIVLILMAGIDKEHKKIDSSLILFSILLVFVYLVYLSSLDLKITYDLSLTTMALIFYVINSFFIKDDKSKNLVNFCILILVSTVFVNAYIMLLTVGLTGIISLLHRLFAKTNVPVAFYYSVFIISIFISLNFII